MEQVGWVILAFILGGVQTLAACALGGWLVYRTKREGHESLFTVKTPTGEVGSLDDLSPPDTDDPVPGIFERFEQQNAEFLRQQQAAERSERKDG